jgi:23S rRNA maturation mini-RNase III
MIDEQYDVAPLCKQSMRISAIYQALIRKGLITETEDKLTTLGKDLLEFLNAKNGAKIIKRKPATTDFEEWWKIYPGTDSFEHKGKKFIGTRAIRKGKDECRLKFDKIILEGEYTAAQLIAALKYEVLQKKESSVQTNSNRMTFMQNSVTYLNQRAFEAYIELINSGEEITESQQKPKGGTDI